MQKGAEVIITEDKVKLQAGDRAFDYYGMKPGVIGNVDSDGWFDFTHDDGTRSILDGSRICSTEFAKRKGWV